LRRALTGAITMRRLTPHSHPISYIQPTAFASNHRKLANRAIASGLVFLTHDRMPQISTQPSSILLTHI
jgi:hypothetical protein